MLESLKKFEKDASKEILENLDIDEKSLEYYSRTGTTVRDMQTQYTEQPSVENDTVKSPLKDKKSVKFEKLTGPTFEITPETSEI